ncbi:Abhydrolase domain-containing protein [Grifola frondosa]|uniref:Abhydrolase domain-containing protein n=1 Tax=Grifola frondosa TaxID=5627 RepID=A0A1C7MEK6_GRIFR|nr:Abhydrolase domain-containing protein [Grifola frondosa]
MMGVFLSFVTAAYYIPKLHYASSPATVSARSSPGSKDIQRVSLRALVEARCPSLFQNFRPAWWLFSGHLQTAYCVLGDFSRIDKVEYDRTLLRTLDGGTIGIDITPPGNEDTLKEDTPIVVVLHGLTGGSHESYVRAILAPACTPVEKGGLGYRGIVVNFRGCAGVPITTIPACPADWRGFSLGANVLTRYLAEEGKQSRLIAGCALGCPWDLVKNSDSLQAHWFQRNVYSKGMAQNLQKLTERHISEFAQFGDHPATQAVRNGLVEKAPSLLLFDNTVTSKCGGSSPPFPFPTAYDYYRWASSHKSLAEVRVPFLAINADDDPIVQSLPIHAGDNEWVVFAVTRGGGHLGWFEAGSSFGQVKRWISKPVVEWLRAVGEILVVDGPHGRPLREVDGFLKEVGRDDIGCKEIGEGGHVVVWRMKKDCLLDCRALIDRRCILL